MNKAIDISVLDGVIKRTIETVETSKTQIFDIAEDARQQGNSLKFDLHELRQEISKVIQKVDALELAYRKSRNRLVQVSRNFHMYTEDDIRIAYEEASRIQVELSIYRERENNLKRLSAMIWSGNCVHWRKRLYAPRSLYPRWAWCLAT